MSQSQESENFPSLLSREVPSWAPGVKILVLKYYSAELRW